MIKNVKEVVTAVKKGFEVNPSENLSNVFLSLQSVCENSKEVKGSNYFKIQ